MAAKVGIITFPGTLDEADAARAVRYAGGEPISLWHNDDTLQEVDAVIVPGGFSYGDYVRVGAIASHSPIMYAVKEAAERGVPILGICNGFQILCEAGLLPGALVKNHGLHFVCRDQWLEVVNNKTTWTNRFTKNANILVPLKSGQGRYVADSDTLSELDDNGQVLFRYLEDNPNGSFNSIAGISNSNGRIAGLMPHPEHAIDPLTGPSVDGLGLFVSAFAHAVGV